MVANERTLPIECDSELDRSRRVCDRELNVRSGRLAEFARLECPTESGEDFFLAGLAGCVRLELSTRSGEDLLPAGVAVSGFSGEGERVRKVMLPAGDAGVSAVCGKSGSGLASSSSVSEKLLVLPR